MQEKDALLRWLDRCTARILVNKGSESGTGFFVAPGYLLTCAHVVSSASGGTGIVEVEWDGQRYPATVEQITDKKYPDLALLQVELADHPCVYLSAQVALHDTLYTYGYPRAYSNGDPLTFEYIGPTGGSNSLLTFYLGNLRSGFSGSALLDLRTGAVCGVTKLTAGEQSLLGGRGVPIAQAFQAFPRLVTLQEAYHRQDTRWAELLTPEQCKENGLSQLRTLPSDKAVEIFFSYHDNEKDQRLFKALEKQLSVLRRQGIIDDWHKGKIAISEEVEAVTLKHLETARIICLLISPDYLADDELYEVHIARAMQRRDTADVRVIPILLRPIEDLESAPFGKLQLLPRDRVPMSQKDLDTVSAEIAREIRGVAKHIRFTL